MARPGTGSRRDHWVYCRGLHPPQTEGPSLTQIADRPAGTRSVPRIVTELPGPEARRQVTFDESVTSPSLPRAYPFVPLRGEGSTVEDVDGNRFLDFAAGIAVNSTGHCHPDVVAAIERQAHELLHYSASDFYLPIYAELAAELARIAPIAGDARVFLTNSGTEAVEAAIKLARYATRRHGLVAFLGAFHGRSYGSVSLTASKAKYHGRFGPLLPGVVHVPYGSPGLDELEARVFKRLLPADEVAAVFVEPIQGEGGYVVPDDDFLPRLRRLCDDNGILLVADEVQTGMGRTGRMWAVQHWSVEPDIVLAAKGIASGMPLGATIARADVMAWETGAHGSTFGGNPVSCAAALATLKLLEGGLVENAAERGRQAFDALAQVASRFPRLVRDVRGKGLMIGVAFDSPESAEAVQWAAFQRGLLVLEAGEDAIRLSPPLVVTEAETATGIELFDEAVAEVSRARDAVLAAADGAGAIGEVEAAG